MPPQKVPFSKISDDVIACDLWFGPPQLKILATPIYLTVRFLFFQDLKDALKDANDMVKDLNDRLEEDAQKAKGKHEKAAKNINKRDRALTVCMYSTFCHGKI